MKFFFSNSSRMIFYLIFLAVCLKTHASLPVLFGHFIFDLYANGVGDITKLAEEWSINGTNNIGQPKVSACAVPSVLGGFSAMTVGGEMQRTYGPLPPHSLVTYTMTPVFIGTWGPGNYIYIKMDGKTIFSFEPYTITSIEIPSTCGTPIHNYWIATVKGKVFHSNQTLTLTVSSSPLNTGASLGLFNVEIILTRAKENDHQESCIIPPTSLSLGLPNVCKCMLDYYYDEQSSSCKVCHSKCYQCFGPSASDCYACGVWKTYDIEVEACVGCAGPNCRHCHGTRENQCDLCLNKVTYWNYTCHNTCPSPYVSESHYFTICKTPCQPDRYMLWDKTCSDSCTFPLVPRIDGQAKFCDSPCVNGSNEYLFWNGSCQSVCPFFPRSQNGYNFCDACQPNYYMFPNSSCLSGCPSPYKNRSIGGSNFCDYPCKEDARFFFEKNQSCLPVCEYPYSVRETIFCYFEISQEEAKRLETTKEAIGSASSSGFLAGGVISLINISPAAIFASFFVGTLGSIKYIDIKYPSNMRYYFDVKTNSPYAILSNPPPQLVSLITKYPLPEKFGEDEDLHSSFLINFWSKILILSALTLVIGIFCWINAKCGACKSLIKKIDNRLRWNLPVTLFVSYYGDIVLYASFELRTMNLNSSLHILSFLLCFILNFLLIASFFQLVHVIQLSWKVKAYLKNSEHDKELRNTSRLLTQYEVVFKESKTATIPQQTFFCIFASRTIIFFTIIAYLPYYPLAQAISITILSVGMLLYLGITRPVKSHIDLGMYIIQELIMLTAKMCVLILSVFDSRAIQNYNTRETLGQIIINCFIAFSVTSILYSAIQTFLFLYAAFKATLNFFVKNRIIHQEKMNLPLEQESTDQFKPVNASMEYSIVENIPRQDFKAQAQVKEGMNKSIEIQPFQPNNREIDEIYLERKVVKRGIKVSRNLAKIVESSFKDPAKSLNAAKTIATSKKN